MKKLFSPFPQWIVICMGLLLCQKIAYGANEAPLVAHFPLDLTENKITETVTGKTFVVENNFNRPENVLGAEGYALRLDGYSTFAIAEINTAALSNNGLTVSLWCAMETYPVMNPDNQTSVATHIAGNLRDDLKTGFAFTLNNSGRYAFEVYVGGVKVTCYDAYDNLPKYVWAFLTATVNTTTKEVKMFRNGDLVAKTSFSGNTINIGNNSFIIGKSFADEKVGVFRTNVINGLVDDIRIYSKAFSDAEIQAATPQNPADLTIPKSRHEADIQRPQFHGQPATNWTNEPHGLVFYNNKYHIFFQKNANGPYMARLHWGHLSSSDLLNWTEEKIAFGPEKTYDTKGTWSGCVFTDDEFTAGVPTIFYTGVDYVKASIDKAVPNDIHLLEWKKDNSNPLIANRPSGLSDDFRDPYVFKYAGELFMIVGTSKNGLGATTLHKYNAASKTWSNDGKIFYQSPSAAYGTFWEMPVIVPMNDGKWLFIVTPLGNTGGTQTLYWVGGINGDGTFNPFFTSPKKIELGDMSTHGYGLLSPSVLQKDGKTIAIGIVPDKLPSEENLRLGWAHLYSMPREWTLDADNNLIQTPYEGVHTMRVQESVYYTANQDVFGNLSMSPVSGKCVEINGSFVVGSSSKFGYNVRKSGGNYISIYYTPSENKITVDARRAQRLINDANTYNGLYETLLPNALNAGNVVDLHVFMDHSILDIFVNNSYAFSIRIFPTDAMANDVEFFSEGGPTRVNYLQAWKLNPTGNATGLSPIHSDNEVKIYTYQKQVKYEKVSLGSKIDVYNSTGLLVRTLQTQTSSGSFTLPSNQLYIVKISGQTSFVEKIIL